MTLIVGVNGPESIWMLADRRLSKNGRPVTDNARKIMFLEAPDGKAILGYAGLGATALKTEPCDWMSAVLRGRNHPLEAMLNILVAAMKTQLPRHMVGMPRMATVHDVVAPAFLNGSPTFYMIRLAMSSDRKNLGFGYARMVSPLHSPKSKAPRVSIGGSGSTLLARDQTWIRPLLRLVKAHDEGKISAPAVAKHMAALNNRVHRTDKSVGPKCIVAWRLCKGGGADIAFDGLKETAGAVIPTVSNGVDITAFVNAVFPIMQQALNTALQTRKKPEIDAEAIKGATAGLPASPDENLR